MSFLLRNRSSTGVGRVLPRGPAPRGDGTIRPRSTSRGADPPNSSSAPGMQSGNQMMLQRNVHPSQKQTISQKGSKLHDLEQESQGMISMSEGTVKGVFLTEAGV